MTDLRKGILLGALQILIVLSLGAKLLYDRAVRPRVWVQCRVWDPELPLRGRYLGEELMMPAVGFTYAEDQRGKYTYYENMQWAYFEIRDGQLVANSTGSGSGGWVYLQKNADGSLSAIMQQPVLIFVADDVSVPSARHGEELWVEVTLPKAGPPRPVRLGVKNQGVISPVRTG